MSSGGAEWGAGTWGWSARGAVGRTSLLSVLRSSVYRIQKSILGVRPTQMRLFPVHPPPALYDDSSPSQCFLHAKPSNYECVFSFPSRSYSKDGLQLLALCFSFLTLCPGVLAAPPPKLFWGEPRSALPWCFTCVHSCCVGCAQWEVPSLGASDLLWGQRARLA